MDSRSNLSYKVQGTIKVRNLSALPEVLAELGVDLKEFLAQAGLEQSLFANPDHVISYVALGRLLRDCVVATGCDDFGLRVGMRQSIAVLGLAGYVAASAPTVREALQIIISSLRLSDTGGRAILNVERGFATLSWIVTESNVETPEQIDDGALAVCANVMRALRGPQWRPTEACLTRRRPKSTSLYSRFFDAPLRFDADVACLIFEETHLDQAVDGRDANLHEILAPLLDREMAEAQRTLKEEVCDILRVQALSGPLTPDRVASALGISPRTLSRRLSAETVTFSDLAQLVRFEIAQRLLRTEKSISEIAAALGYSDATAFIRAFRQIAGTTPARWRRET